MDVERQRLSFGPSADVYERHRPDYPPAAIRWALGAEPLRVLDVGAGTGKLTRALLAAGHEVVAVEPDAQMRDAFAAAVAGVDVLCGSAEELPVADESFDAVAVGQAYHWFDTSRALPELARVLHPEGLLAVVWNRRDVSEPWVAELSRILVGPGGRRGDPEAERAIESFGPLFTPPEQTTVTHVQPLHLEGLLGLVASRSYTIVLPDGERAAMLAEVAELGRRVAAAGPDGLLRLPYLTMCVRARRAD